jgi:hypothetical protein
MGLKEIGWESVEWTDLAHERDKWWVLLHTVLKLPVKQNVEFLSS